MRKRTILGLVIFIFIFAVCWQLFLTCGFKFFWEDFDVYRLHAKYSIQSEYNMHYKDTYSLDMDKPSKLSLMLAVLKGFPKEFFATQRLFQIGFNAYSFIDRPYQFLIWDLSKLIFNDKVILYRIFKAIIFAINTCVLFLIINRVSRLLALLGVLLYMSSGEIWLAAVYNCQLGLISQCGTILSILLFIKLTEKHSIHYKDTLFYYFLILLTSNFAVLTECDGRYLAIIFFLTVLFFRKKELRFHLPMLVILFLMEFPVLGYIKKIFHPDFSPINLASHPGTHLSTFEFLKAAVSNYKIPRNAAGKYFLVVLYITIITHLLRFIFHKISAVSKRIEAFNPIVKERLFLFMLWFISTLAMSARVRSFSYSGAFSFQLYDLSYFVAPFIIFLCYYVSLISGSIKKPYRTIFIGVCVCLMVTQIFYKSGPRLNKFRKAWGNYFCAWQNTEEYIDKNSDNALALAFTTMHYKPFLFRHSNNKVINTQASCKQSPFCDLNFIEAKFKEEGYSDIFVVARYELKFRGDSERVLLNQKEIFDGDSGDLYDRFKRAIGRPSKPVTYLYHFKFKEG